MNPYILVLTFFSGAIFAGVLVYFVFRIKLIEQTSELEKKSNMLETQLHLSEKAKNEILSHKEHAEKQIAQQFELLAHRIFQEKTEKISEQNLKELAHVLDPIRDRLKEFEKKVEETYSAERTERGVLRGEINKLLDLNKLMSQEAHNLTRALKGDNKIQGNWGELILENILERSGLRKGEEYIVQGTDLELKSQSGNSLRPDIVILLPDQKHLIIDSKMTLNAFESYANSEDSSEKDQAARLHVESLKRHIDGLSDKQYHLSDKLSSPDFVLLFMPLEPAFALAFRLKPDLFQYAWEKNVAIVSPTTLLSTLRTVSALWKQDRREKNALEIARRGGLLYDKFVNLVKDIENLGDKLNLAQKAHSDLTKKMSEGKGNLIDQVEELKRLGAKTEKQLGNLSIDKI